jgi:polyhydroxybutyrate depolymerase
MHLVFNGHVPTSRRWPAAAAVLLLLWPLSSCRGGRAAGTSDARAAIPVGSSTRVLKVGHVWRTYHLYRPARTASPAPLVVVLHGGFGSGTQAEKAYHWDEQADRAGFVVAYPDGLGRAWNTGGGCCGLPGRTGVDDVGFVTAVVGAVGQALPVDSSRVYASGMSNGGILAYTLACRTAVFAAVGPVAATQLGGCSAPRPTSVVHVHGTADHNVPYDGGRGDGPGHVDGPGAQALDATWRGIDSCSAPTATTAGAVTTSVAICPAGRAVELVTVAGAGHQWPGARREPLAEKVLGTDPPSTALDATSVIWQFFAAHPKA